mgnify:CR=1 FL=1
MNNSNACIPDGLMEISSRDGRLVPLPINWNELCQFLEKKVPEDRRAERLLAPLILAGWNFTSDEEKRDRFLYHLEWSVNHGLTERVAEYLQNLAPQDWYYGERQ